MGGSKGIILPKVTPSRHSAYRYRKDNIEWGRLRVLNQVSVYQECPCRYSVAISALTLSGSNKSFVYR